MMVTLPEIVQEGRKCILKSFFDVCFHVTVFFAMTTYSKMLSGFFRSTQSAALAIKFAAMAGNTRETRFQNKMNLGNALYSPAVTANVLWC